MVVSNPNITTTKYGIKKLIYLLLKIIKDNKIIVTIPKNNST